MGILRALRRKALPSGYGGPVQTGSVLSDYYTALMSNMTHSRARPWPVERAVVEGYERVVWVFKAVDAIAGDSARLPFRFRDPITKVVVDDHPLYRVLNGQANPMETGQILRKRLSAQVLLSKRGAFVEVAKNGWGEIARADILPPGRTEIIPGRGADLIDHFLLTRRDGQRVPIAPENVRWFRNPHPLDPYSGVTPLEAIGMSVELDHFARLYNVSFLRNDGRPGGIIGVKGQSGPDGVMYMPPEHMDRVESRFSNGPVEAGKLSVISGELSFVDTAAKPRDMAYGELASQSKVEILGGFGVPETRTGNASGRTWDNAEQELYTYWTLTMAEHNAIIASGWDADSLDDLEGFLDTSDVEVLQRAESKKREEARIEVEKGLRSIKSYADLAGYGDEIDDSPYTRALYVPTGKTPIASKRFDEEALGMGTGTGEEAAAIDPAAGAGSAALAAATGTAPDGAPLDTGSAGSAALAAAQEVVPTAVPALAVAGPQTGTAALAAAQGRTGTAALAAAGAVKALPPGRVHLQVVREGKAAKRGNTSTPSPDDLDRLEAQITAILAALSVRWIERAVARAESPKSRKGTRHWAAEYERDTRVGTKAIDSAKVVDERQWENDVREALPPLLTAAAGAAGAALLVDLAAMTPTAAAAALLGRSTTLVAEVTGMVATAAATLAQRLVATISEADADGGEMGDITGTIRGFAGRLAGWSKTVAGDVAVAITNGAREDAADGLSEGDIVPDDATRAPVIVRQWLSRRDDRVRASHARGGGADGQVQPVGEPFIVGGHPMRFPGDPLGPPHERINCRCRLLHRVKGTGRFVSPPLPEAEAV